MSADVAARLRLLAQDHHDGRLDLAAYRALRAPLLDSLVLNVAAVASAMEITQPRAAVRPASEEAVTRPGKPSAARVAQPGTAKPAGGRLPIGTIAIVVALLAAATVAYWMWLGPVSSGRASDAAGTATQPNRVHDLVTPFIDRADWSDARLASLNASLLELGGAQIAVVAREAWFQHFVDELRQRLKEQQALATAPLTVDNSPLAALAVTVGLDLDSPDAAIHIAALPPPPSASEPNASANTPRVTPAKAESRLHASATTDSASTQGASAARANTPTSHAPSVDAVSASATASSGVTTNSGAHDAVVSNTTSARPASDAGENACRIELIRSRRPLCHDMLPAGAEAPLMALVPAGTFDMGSSGASEEGPVHRVSIREPFAISVYEVSQGDFKQFCDHSHRTCAQQPWSGDDYPVVNVTWDDARAYAAWLSSVTHHRYSLPTEAQWEYAARAGQKGAFPGGDSLSPTDAHYSMLAKLTAAARRSQKFNANAFRLVHTVGNVREWVEDGWTPSFAGAPSDGSTAKPAQATTRVARGGSFTDGAARLRLSMREGLPAGTRDTTTGFRIVRELP